MTKLNSFQTHQLPTRQVTPKKYKLPIAQVDQIAKELAIEFNNEGFTKWYCDVLYKFGTAKVEEWRVRANEGQYPGKLFSMFVKEAESYRNFRGQDNER